LFIYWSNLKTNKRYDKENT